MLSRYRKSRRASLKTTLPNVTLTNSTFSGAGSTDQALLSTDVAIHSKQIPSAPSSIQSIRYCDEKLD